MVSMLADLQQTVQQDSYIICYVKHGFQLVGCTCLCAWSSPSNHTPLLSAPTRSSSNACQLGQLPFETVLMEKLTDLNLAHQTLHAPTHWFRTAQPDGRCLESGQHIGGAHWVARPEQGTALRAPCPLRAAHTPPSSTPSGSLLHHCLH